MVVKEDNDVKAIQLRNIWNVWQQSRMDEPCTECPTSEDLTLDTLHLFMELPEVKVVHIPLPAEYSLEYERLGLKLLRGSDLLDIFGHSASSRYPEHQ